MHPSTETSHHALTRRGVLGALGGVALSSVSMSAAPTAFAAPLPLVRPKSAQAIVSSVGVCAHPNHGKTAYRHTGTWVAAVAALGATYIRGGYAKGVSSTYSTVAELRRHGLKWGMHVVRSLAVPDDVIRQTVADIAARAADVCLFVEGVNEPNYHRSGGTVPSNWRQLTLHKQRVLWQAVRSQPRLAHVKVLSPSLQMVVVRESDYAWFADNGINQYMDYAGTHCYPGGWYPDRRHAELLTPMQRHWKKPVWLTETGYNNATSSTKGAKPVPDDVSATYAPSVVLEAADRGHKVAWYELLNDVDPQRRDVEAHFGLLAVGGSHAPPWTLKPAGRALTSFLAGLRDPGPAYTPAPIGLRVDATAADVRWTPVAKRNGAVTLYLRRAAPCYDPRRGVRLRVPKVPVRVTTSAGTRTVQVGSQVVALPL